MTELILTGAIAPKMIATMLPGAAHLWDTGSPSVRSNNVLSKIEKKTDTAEKMAHRVDWRA